jgi:hypothetical protein
MRRYGIPGPEFEVFTTYKSAKPLLDVMPDSFKERAIDGIVETPLGPMTKIKRSPRGAIVMTGVIKSSHEWRYDVTVPPTQQEAHKFAKSALDPKGGVRESRHLMVEKKLEGTRITVITFSDGINLKSLPPTEISEARTAVGIDHINGEQGCIGPIQNLSSELLNEIDDTILRPTFGALLKNSKH